MLARAGRALHTGSEQGEEAHPTGRDRGLHRSIKGLRGDLETELDLNCARNDERRGGICNQSDKEIYTHWTLGQSMCVSRSLMKYPFTKEPFTVLHRSQSYANIPRQR